MAPPEPQTRLNALRKLLSAGKLSTQDELREELSELDFDVTQSTVSRDLRRLGAVKAIDPSGRTVYRLPSDRDSGPASPAGGIAEMITEIRQNGAMIVIHTTPGSASLVARHVDQSRLSKVIGTIAGDDTVFVAPVQIREIKEAVAQINASLV